MDAQPPFGGQQGDVGGDVAQEGSDLYRLGEPDQLARLVQPGDGGDVGQQAGQPFTLFAAFFEECTPFPGLEAGVGEQGLQIAPDGGHGSFELVVDVLR